MCEGLRSIQLCVATESEALSRAHLTGIGNSWRRYEGLDSFQSCVATESNEIAPFHLSGIGVSFGVDTYGLEVDPDLCCH
jgi:hypothetical protein